MPTHKRDEGHEVQGSTTPDDGLMLTEALTAGAIGHTTFALDSIVGNMQGDLLLTVTFPDGEVVRERLDMTGMLRTWLMEIDHSKRMRDDWNEDGTRKSKGRVGPHDD